VRSSLSSSDGGGLRLVLPGGARSRLRLAASSHPAIAATLVICVEGGRRLPPPSAGRDRAKVVTAYTGDHTLYDVVGVESPDANPHGDGISARHSGVPGEILIFVTAAMAKRSRPLKSKGL
jgi:hypothetical protein